MPTANINGVTIHYIEKGDPNAPPIVLLHGFPLSADMWVAQIEALSPRHRVIAPDFRGFGRSGPTGPFSIEQLADDVHALIGQLKLGKVILAALSMGGYVALAYVKKYQGTLASLILIDTKAEGDSADGRANRDRLIATAREHGAKAIGDAMLPKLIPESAAKSRPQLVRDLRAMTDTTDPQTLAHALAAMRDRPDQTASLASIAVPTLILVGDQDAITPPDVARAMHEKIPRSQLKVIAGSGHMSPMEQPAQVNVAIEQFL
ncbi:MAG TPA: alpha/beta fold hydrolase [Tepidisphaeraceae bacterium]